jgi:hypothetical protein
MNLGTSTKESKRTTLGYGILIDAALNGIDSSASTIIAFSVTTNLTARSGFTKANGS